MEIFATFETWHLGDGNYPPLKKGQLVNLSFEIEPDVLTAAQKDAPQRFHHLGQAEYEFTGVVLCVYRDDSSDRIVVIEADQFRFYINSPLTEGVGHGDTVSGRGTLALDHYIWVEFLADYSDPPDLFYKLRVMDICRVQIPERFIVRSGRNVSLPTRVKLYDYGPGDLTNVESITDEEYVSFIVQFADADVPLEPIPRTFL
ncbi:MAG: hypothetical protein ABSH42_09340 [Bryobacteraceae bacterium]|jgi:hypothetical protein